MIKFAAVKTAGTEVKNPFITVTINGKQFKGNFVNRHDDDKNFYQVNISLLNLKRKIITVKDNLFASSDTLTSEFDENKVSITQGTTFIRGNSTSAPAYKITIDNLLSIATDEEEKVINSLISKLKDKQDEERKTHQAALARTKAKSKVASTLSSLNLSKEDLDKILALI